MKDAFAGAEVEPGANVWVSIELQLEREKAAILGQRIRRYQLLAAASVLFAVTVSFGLYLSRNTEPRALATVDGRQRDSSMDKMEEPSLNPGVQDSGRADHESPHPGNASASDATVKRKPADNKQDFVAGASQLTGEPGRDMITPPVDPPSSALAEIPAVRQVSLKDEAPEVDPVQAMLARLEAREAALRGDDEPEKTKGWENLWTSVGVAAGSFKSTNANVSAAPGNALALNNALADKEVRASGSSYSVGLNVGTRVAERWVLQGGVNFLNQSSDFIATSAVRQGASTFRPASMHSLRDAATSFTGVYDNKLVATAPYEVNNQVKYMTIPLQAGYLLVNRDVGIQVNAGVATDIFLQNRISAEGVDAVQAEVLNPGDDSPFRNVNFSGLVGTEISYRFGDHYRVALSPGLRYPFTSVYKTELDVRSSPLTLDLGLRFRYIFH